jgi:septal ring factor EnvC (AmiA/AmiB activator)
MMVILGLILGIPFSVNAQDEITRRQAELEELREEIRKSEAAISEYRESEQATLELLDAYDRKTTLVRSLITKLRNEESRAQRQVDSLKKELSVLEEELAFLKDHYAKYVASVYKAGKVHDIELLLTASSFNQALVRSEYLRRFAEQRRSDAGKIMAKKSEAENLQALLQENLTNQRRMLAEKGAEEDKLAVLIEDRRDVLKEVRRDRKNLQKQIDRKMKALRELEGLIAGLIEAERIRKEKAAGEPTPPVSISGAPFPSRKGKLRWPVRQGSVVARFGNQTHPTLKTVTQNPGIDIAVQPGSDVTAVAGGRVARIWWLVSYGNLIILDHGGGYRTIYAHLAEIRVAEGQEVAEGDVIATSGETVDGARIHFEIWKEREKQNPEQWLAGR